ncbi:MULTISPECIES: hypothetical protein [unclassified Microcoleus]|uniref:hypothetical protein n=2 Tax=unclassified Microcoleus TaxID=2642155 RepID=UPI002FD74348
MRIAETSSFCSIAQITLGMLCDRSSNLLQSSRTPLKRIMTELLDETLSIEIAARIKSNRKNCFDNAYKAALATDGAIYVQGFLAVPGSPYKPIEYSWIELDERIIDPTFPHLGFIAQDIHYFPVQRFSVKKLKAIIDESKEDYPEDDPLPVYGNQPYEYYGDVMLGGSDYQNAYDLAASKCRELNQPKKPELN